jgi:hypothetical protein
MIECIAEDVKNTEKYYYFAVVLTLDPKKKDVNGKSFEVLQKKIIEWVQNIKKIKDVLYSGPFFDIGNDNNNIHVNLTIKTELKTIELVRKKYFNSWCLRKGYVSIKEIWDFKGWLEYAKKNNKIKN